jgi:DNA-binding transcriptional LysR family regulator
MLDVHVEELETLASKLRDRSLDFAAQLLRGRLVAGDSFFDECDVQVLFEDEMVVAAGLNSPLARRRKIDLADLVDERWIVTDPPSWKHKLVADAFHARGLPMPMVVLKTFSTYIRTNLVASGNFIATFPKSVAHFYADRSIERLGPAHVEDRRQPIWKARLIERAQVLASEW